MSLIFFTRDLVWWPSVPGEDLIGFGQLKAIHPPTACLQADPASQATRGVSFRSCLAADSDVQVWL
eukprot:m.112254 g.112254  ORF g.112254 m.112254 type:complete len:66 (+) comp15404_c1_seq14:1693-1890(+)